MRIQGRIEHILKEQQNISKLNERMNEDRLVKQVVNYRVHGRRDVGRHRKE